MKERYLVTGAAGHLGSAILRDLLDQGKAVRILILPGEAKLPEGDFEICYGDVRDKESLRGFFAGAGSTRQILIHCAGIVSIASRPLQIVRDVNVAGTKNIVDLSEEYGIDKLVYVSSVHAIPEKPHGETVYETSRFDCSDVVGQYAKSKSEATAYVLAAAQRGLNASIVHPSGITGPYDFGGGHLTTLVIDYYKGRLRFGMQGGYDFVDVRDVSKGILSCCEKGRAGDCYILSNQYYTVKELLDLLHEVTGKRRIRIFLPLWFVRLTAPLAELYYRILRQPPLYTAYSIYTLTTNAVFSHEKATHELGYEARAMRETLEDTVSWLKSAGRI